MCTEDNLPAWTHFKSYILWIVVSCLSRDCFGNMEIP